MKIQIALACILFLLFSCKAPNEEASKPNNQEAEKSTAPSSISSKEQEALPIAFEEIDTSGILMSPLRGISDGGRESIINWDYKDGGGNFWNILFYNSKTGETNMLTDKKVVFRSYDLQNSSSGESAVGLNANYIFYTAITDDVDKDKKLTPQDASYLFVSDKLGKGFRQISPTNFHVKRWQFIKSANIVLLTTVADSDKNGVFDIKDKTHFFKYNLYQQQPAVEIFDTLQEDKIISLYRKYWSNKE